MLERVISMDITNFMTWFINQVVSIFKKTFNILDSITFSGISLLDLIITIVILTALIGVLITVVQNVGINLQSERSDKSDKKYTKENNDKYSSHHNAPTRSK